MLVSTSSRRSSAFVFTHFCFLLPFIVLAAALGASAQTSSAFFLGAQSTVTTTGLSAPAAVAVDDYGNLYIADTGNNRVVMVTAAGVQSTVLSGTVLGSALNAPNAVALHSGNLYVTDPGNNRVLEVTAKGAVSTVGTGLSDPSGVAVDDDGPYIADTGNNRIVYIGWGGVGQGQYTVIANTDKQGGITLSKPTGLSLLNNGLMIADTGNNRVIVGGVSDEDFGYQATLSSGLSKPTGVALTDTSSYPFLTTWIADTGNNRLLYEYYNGSKTVGSALGTGLSAPGGMAAECGSCGGNVFIADTGNNRIVKVGTQVADFGAVNVGSVTPAQTFFFAFTASTTLNAKTPFQTLTMGAAHLDFQNAGAGTCAAGGYAAGRACEVNVTFKPTLAGARAGAVVLDNSTGNAVATVYLHGTGQGPQIAYDPGVQTTLASGLSDPRGTAVDGSGNVYVADFGVDQIVKLIPAGVSSRFASVGSPESLAVDGAGNLYTTGTNSGGRSICLVSAGGAWVSCTFDSSEGTVGVAVDGWGYLYGADSVNQDVWYSGTSSGTISGGFTPEAVAVDSAGNLYIVDRDNWLVWEHTPAGNWSTVGSGYNRPQGVAVDQAGNVFVADMGNNQVVKVTPAGVQSTVGTGLSLPSAVAVDGTGNIYITDLGDGRLIKINRSTPPSLSFASTAVGKTSSDSPKEVTVENIGNAPLTFPVPSTGKNASLSTGFTLGTATTCPELSTSSSPATLAAGGACSYQVSFTPKVSGASIKGSLVLTDNNLNVAKATQTIALSGRATAAVVAVSWPAPVPIAAGTPLSSRQLDATASVPGKFVYSPAAGSKPAKGTVKLTTTFTPADTTRYKTATAAVNLVVK